jgi:hypothetical protein
MGNIHTCSRFWVMYKPRNNLDVDPIMFIDGGVSNCSSVRGNLVYSAMCCMWHWLWTTDVYLSYYNFIE